MTFDRTFAQEHVRRVLHILTSLAFVCLCLLTFTGTSWPESDTKDDPEAFRQNTVKVEATEHGFGFIVGEKDGRLYIATARHVLVGDTEQPDSPPVKSATVTFFSDQGTHYMAEVLETHADDLAVLRLPTPNGFHWIKKCLVGPDAQKRGTKVWFIGRNDSWYVPVNAGNVSSDQPSPRSLIDVDGLPVRRGTSGAPLVTERGIVGMIQNDSEDDTRVLTIEFIRNAFHNWNYPWSLQLADAPSPKKDEPPQKQPIVDVSRKCIIGKTPAGVWNSSGEVTLSIDNTDVGSFKFSPTGSTELQFACSEGLHTYTFKVNLSGGAFPGQCAGQILIDFSRFYRFYPSIVYGMYGLVCQMAPY